MTLMPLQYSPVERGPGWTLSVTEGNASEATAGLRPGGVQPSVSACANLQGLARSLCYASQYGISV